MKGIEKMHELNIAHWDLKPENILMDWNFNVKICDLGCSKKFQEDETDSVICGT